MGFLEKTIKFISYLVVLFSVSIYYTDTPIWKLFLFKDFNSMDWTVLISKKNKDLGKVQTLVGGGLKRKYEDEGFFSNIKTAELVYQGDTISTDSSTKAVLLFKDGSQLEINPMSMIKLDFNQSDSNFLGISKAPKIEVLQGVVADVGTKSLTITQAPKEIKEVQITQIPLKTRVPSDQLKDIPLPKREIASVQEQPLNNQENTEQKAESVEVEPPQNFAPVVEIPPTPKVIDSPPPIKPLVKKYNLKEVLIEKPLISGTESLSDNNYKGEELRDFFVDISWESIKNAEEYEIEFYTNFHKNEKIFQAKTKENKYRYLQIFNGKLFYVVKAKNQQSILATSKINEVEFNFLPPTLKNPSNFAELDKSSTLFFFTWEKKNFTQEYIFEIAKNGDFSTAYSKTIKNNFIKIPLLSGEYTWRVRSKNGNFVSPASKEFKLKINN